MWHIGDLQLDGRVILGPMAGISFNSYRSFMEPFGIAASVTEMTSDAGIIHSMKRTNKFIDFQCTRPTGLQIFGSDPELLAEAASVAVAKNPDISFIDVNMGCPVPKVIRKGAGSALMKEPKKCGEIIRKIKASVDVPVTAKIRIGTSASNINFKEVIEEMTAAGIDAVTVHPRTRDEQYYGRPHYDLVKDLRSEISVPLIISGNIYSLDDAIFAKDITGADAVMVARGGVGNPFLVTQIDHYFRTGERLENPNMAQQVDWCFELAQMIFEEKGDDQGMRRMRMFAPKFVSACHRCKDYRRDLALYAKDYALMECMLLEVKAKLGDRRMSTHVFNELEE